MEALKVLLTLILWAACMVCAFFSLYLLALTVAGLAYKRKTVSSGPPSTRFAILVPAHDEEVALPRLLMSLDRAEYPKHMYRIFVVADNCTDATTALGRMHGATVFERLDAVHMGKGFAVQWLLHHVRMERWDYDAYLLLDADCIVSPNFLQAMDERLRAGAKVAQGYYTVSNPGESPTAALRYMALVLMHHARPRGRQVLGLSCGLFGTGIGFQRDVLDAHDWNAYTLAEDVEYFLNLTGEGIRVEFVLEAVVSSAMPAKLRDAKSQNLRWEKGRLQMLRRHGPKLLLKSIHTRDPRMFDAAVQQAIPPLSLFAPASVGLSVITLLVGIGPVAGLSLLGTSALALHGTIGLMTARVHPRYYWALALLPWFMGWKLGVYILALLPSKTQWVRTSRTRG